GARDGELLREEPALAPELLDAPDVQPGPLEDGLALELVELGRDRALVRHRSGPQLRIVIRPRPLRGFRELLRGSLRGLHPVPSSLPPTGPCRRSRRSPGR